MNLFKKAEDLSQPVPVIRQCSVISRTVSMDVDIDDFRPYSISPEAFDDPYRIAIAPKAARPSQSPHAYREFPLI